jgi:hypothetical protein
MIVPAHAPGPAWHAGPLDAGIAMPLAGVRCAQGFPVPWLIAATEYRHEPFAGRRTMSARSFAGPAGVSARGARTHLSAPLGGRLAGGGQQAGLAHGADAVGHAQCSAIWPRSLIRTR